MLFSGGFVLFYRFGCFICEHLSKCIQNLIHALFPEFIHPLLQGSTAPLRRTRVLQHIGVMNRHTLSSSISYSLVIFNTPFIIIVH